MSKNPIRNAARQVLEFSVEKDEWDEMPMLFVYWTVPGDDELHSAIVALAGGHPAQLLRALSANAMNGEMPQLLEGELAGLALFTEGWAIVRDKDDPEQQAKVDAHMAAGKPYSEFEGAIEQKGMDWWDGKDYGRFTFNRGAENIEDLENKGFTFDGVIVNSLKLTYMSLDLARLGKE